VTTETPAPAAAPPAAPGIPVGPPRPRATRSPARRRIQLGAPPKAFDHTGYADEATLGLGALAHLTDTPAWAVIVLGALGALGVWWWSWNRFQHRGVTLFAIGVTVASTAWVTWAAAYTPWTLGSILALVAGTLALGPVYAALRWQTDKRNEKEQTIRAEANAMEKQHRFVRILAKAGAPDVTIDHEMDGDIDEAQWKKGEREFPAGFSLALALGEKAPEVKSLISMLPNIEKIASATTRYPIRPGAIQIRPNPTSAHKCEMIIPTKDVLAELIPIPERPGTRSINDLIEVAVSVDGTVLGWDCHADPHGMVAGMTDAGKTVFLDAHLFEATRSNDCVNALISGAKPVRALAPWLKPFVEGHIGPDGKPVNPVIDWFAADVEEAAMILIDASIACERRQQSAAVSTDERWQATPDAPAWIIWIDESPKFLKSTRRFVNHKGEEKTFSELLLDLETVARSEDVHLFYLTQRGTVSMNGADAGDIKSQTSYRAGFHATGIIDANAVFNTSTHGVNVESLPKGGLYLEMQGYSQPVLAKGMYADAARKQRAAVEHSIYCGPLDAWTTEPDEKVGYEGMRYYDGRWLRKNQQAFLRQLCPNPVQVVPRGTLPLELTGGAREVETMRQFGAWMDANYADECATPYLLADFLRTYSPSTERATPAAGNVMGGFEQWMSAEYKGEAPTDGLLQDFVNQMWADATDEQKAEFRAAHVEQTGADDEIERLDALFEAPAFETPAEPAFRINPDLRKDTRSLLEALAGSDLLHTTAKYIPARDVHALAVEVLEWESSSTAGGRRVAAALRAVNVVKVEPRPKIDDRKTIAYLADDLRAAVDKNRMDGDQP
jgi:hypothetical protein